MKKLFIFVVIISINVFCSIAQQRTAHISFRKIDHDFKTIKEAKGPVTVVFGFINTGGAPITLQSVTASCGCTTPDYSKAPVMPGDSGFVKATYDPNGRPGPFTKDITVVSNADNSPIILKITGNVIPRELKIEDQYRYTMGNLRLESSHLGYGTLVFGSSKILKLKMVNPGSQNVTIGFINIPSWLKMKSNKVVLKPQEKTEIDVEYNTTKRNDWGFLIDYLLLTIDGKQDLMNKITITADIVEDFSKLSPGQKDNAPKITFENTNYDFGTMAEGNVVECDFKFTNTGKSDLKIRKLSTTCGCTTTALKTETIKPGESSSIHVSFNTKGYKNAQTKTVSVVSNDPNASKITLWVKGTVL
jgi:hypothetical protein